MALELAQDSRIVDGCCNGHGPCWVWDSEGKWPMDNCRKAGEDKRTGGTATNRLVVANQVKDFKSSRSANCDFQGTETSPYTRTYRVREHRECDFELSEASSRP